MEENNQIKTVQCKRDKCSLYNPDCEILAEQELKQNKSLEQISTEIQPTNKTKMINSPFNRDYLDDWDYDMSNGWGLGVFPPIYT